MLAPFLQYLYCEPQRQPQHALLRHRLLRVLLPAHPGAGSVLQEPTSQVADSLLQCLCQLVPHMQVTHFRVWLGRTVTEAYVIEVIDKIIYSSKTSCLSISIKKTGA